MGYEPIPMLILLLAGHALCDYPLQGDFLARGKNHTAPLPGMPWWQALAAHSAIHAGMVMLVTGVWWLALMEYCSHAMTDFYKCDGKIGFNTDQAIHIACKLAWWLIAIKVVL